MYLIFENVRRVGDVGFNAKTCRIEHSCLQDSRGSICKYGFITDNWTLETDRIILTPITLVSACIHRQWLHLVNPCHKGEEERLNSWARAPQVLKALPALLTCRDWFRFHSHPMWGFRVSKASVSGGQGCISSNFASSPPCSGFHQNTRMGSSRHGSAVRNLTRIHEDVGSIPGLDHWVKDPALPWAVV